MHCLKKVSNHTSTAHEQVLSPVHTSNYVEATLSNATMSNVASTLLPFLATMSKQRSTLLPKTATMSNEFCVEISSFRKVERCFDIVASVDRALVCRHFIFILSHVLCARTYECWHHPVGHFGGRTTGPTQTKTEPAVNTAFISTSIRPS